MQLRQSKPSKLFVALQGVEVTEPIRFSELAKQHGIKAYDRRRVPKVLISLGLRWDRLGWPTKNGVKSCIVVLPHGYDLAEYPYHTLEYRILNALPAKRADILMQLGGNRESTHTILAKLRRERKIKPDTNGVYHVT